jgi:hypothetical protein
LWIGIRTYSSIQFDRNCEGYIKRAADANTVELATSNLAIAVQYLEQKNMTSGYTSILCNTPDADVGFWYNNLKTSLEELKDVQPEVSRLERTNILMKLRETLLDGGENGVSVTTPEGISVFPYNIGLFFLCIIGIISGICGVILFLVGIEKD